MKKYLLMMLSFGLLSFAWAQERTITGKVTDAESGETIPGANIVEKGTSNGTITDFDGNYSISVGDGATLMVSFVGYESQEVNVGAMSVVDVQLSLDVQSLSEVVVVGYGTQDKKEITSAVVAIDEESFNVGNINNPAELLQGKVPGLSVYNKGGDPNSSGTIRLRGISTVGANTEPLVVVDGVIGASLENVDPNDIESVNVLKDGSAAAIYGSRGSSGVILITTKKGKRNAGVSATYNGYVAAATILKGLPVMTASEYIDAGGNDLGSETDWLGEVTRTGVSNVHNVAVSGGSQNTTYRLATNFRDVNGILSESGFDQVNARASISHFAMNDKLKIDFNMSMTNRESNFSFNEALRYASLYNPTAPIKFDNGEYFQAVLFDNFNPVAIIEQNQNVGKRKNLNFNVQGEYSITDALSFTVNYGQQYTNNLNGQFYPSTSFFRGLNRDGLATRFTDDSKFELLESFATYNGAFGDINLTVSAGYSFQENFYESLNLSVGNFPSNDLGFYGIDQSGDRVLGIASNVVIDSYASPEERIIAFFGRVNMTFDDAIFFNASVRREGSTKLGVDNRWGLFPAFGLGVDLNNYLGLDAFSQLKLRAGYGVTGALPSASGQAQDLYEYDFTGGGTVSFTRAGNPDLKWEEKAEVNIGVDFGVMGGRLTGAVDVYQRNITDFILERDVDPGVYGASTRYENVGALKTNGAELSLAFDAIQNSDFTWNTGIVASTYKTTLEEFTNEEQVRGNLGSPGQNGTNMIRVAVGEELGQIWGPVFSGVDENGAPTFEDLNGDGTVVSNPASALDDDADMEVLGNGLPSFELGWTNQITFGAFDFNAFFRGAFGHSLVNTFRAFYEPIDAGAINSYNRIITENAVDGLTSAQYSSLYVEKADFLRLDNVTAGYTINTDNFDAFKSIRLYLNVQNAFVITNYSGLDPDPVLQDFGSVDNGGYAETTPDVLAPGIDRRNNYFTARTFTFGINLGF
jgi:TonB-linked SusC/RagA family outer membrane protein